MELPYPSDGYDGRSPLLSQILSIGMITSWLPRERAGIMGTLTMFMMGWLLEMGRDAYSWFSERWKFQYSLTAEFHEGDPAYDWVLAFLTKEQVWKRSWNFKISAKTLQRKNGVEASEISKGHNSENAEYVPTYQKPQLFRWSGYWVEITRSIGAPSYDFQTERTVSSSTIFLTVYTRDVSAVSSLVEYARTRYMEMSQPHVIIHTSSRGYHPFYWSDCKRKLRRSLDSVILEAGVLDTLLADACEFLGMEDWYQTAGIPYRRGYLLYGPPGSGKTSTIYALAGELGLEIYSLSLASSGIDDSILAQAVACIPKRSIFLLEDIDCAFSRNDESNNNGNLNNPVFGMWGGAPRCNVTLSGLLNILDGVASQEGILFFATTNHIEDLDNALIRPGRIDRKIQYHHAVKQQAASLFKRFFPVSHCTPESAKEDFSEEDKTSLIESLSAEFSAQIPEKTFTTAELQGFLLTCKFKPEKAVKEAKKWAENTIKEKKELEEKKKAKQEKAQEKRDMEEVEKLQSTLLKMGVKAERKESSTEAPKEKVVPKAENARNSSPDTPSSARRTQSPDSAQESDSDSWTITEDAQDAGAKRAGAGEPST
ncbi:P-loop containing nucleoside triphosphate hydrolase protein [Macrolepiota fuliginosa MF-IS2]|uniref:P-loop containing nucleoside triphosphate hydrolase protein n=1 Tax=Macrolepiota fuliginosa MF-IS2 TaxID=1400762 RepID=A0A9P5XIF8_9AGAR|nr:P-loop containing nucleoside triphosphate hydrolase protein [Macrolepiota fuliginosa MF-IS2]